MLFGDATRTKQGERQAGLCFAQAVDHATAAYRARSARAKSEVISSIDNLITLIIGVWLSLVERLVRDQEVASSNLVTPTIAGVRYVHPLF